MKDQPILTSLQDFSLIRTHVQQYTSDLELSNDALGFMFFALDIILWGRNVKMLPTGNVCFLKNQFEKQGKNNSGGQDE